MKPEALRRIIAANIKREIAAQNISVPFLADHAGVNRSYVYRVLEAEVGPSTDWLCKVAAALKVEPSALLESPSQAKK